MADDSIGGVPGRKNAAEQNIQRREGQTYGIARDDTHDSNAMASVVRRPGVSARKAMRRDRVEVYASPTIARKLALGDIQIIETIDQCAIASGTHDPKALQARELRLAQGIDVREYAVRSIVSDSDVFDAEIGASGSLNRGAHLDIVRSVAVDREAAQDPVVDIS